MHRLVLLPAAVLVAIASLGGTAGAQEDTEQEPDEEVHDIAFPVIGDVSYTDTFGEPRGSGRTHEGQDLLGDKMQELVAADSGVLTIVTWPQPSYGYYIELTADDGWRYSYVHINNDTPGTDDGAATREQVYGPGVEEGLRVERGALIAYLGDSGNAEHTTPHLHFEMQDPDGRVVNPYASLRAADQLDAPTSEPEPSPIPRLAGDDRVDTAIAASARGWPDGSTSAVLAAGDAYAEALPASVLAARGGAPLLLETGASLSSSVAAELDRLGADEVVVIGSVAVAVEEDLRAAGRTVRRVGAAGDPVTTAAAIAREIGGSSGTVAIVNRSRFADGVSAVAVAAAQGWPVLLSDATTVPQVSVDTWRTLEVGRVVLVGGTAVIGANIEAFVRERGRCGGEPGCAAERLAGADRYATSVATAERALEAGSSVATVLLGTGTNYPDTLSAGALAARLGGIALQVDGSGQRADGASRSFLSSRAGAIDTVAILGGTAAVTSAADRAIQEALGLS